jgi:hypothetical protein
MIALALDGVGSAAVEMLAIQACNYFEEKAKIDGLFTSMPLNPGMVGWPVDMGQPQIFSLWIVKNPGLIDRIMDDGAQQIFVPGFGSGYSYVESWIYMRVL